MREVFHGKDTNFSKGTLTHVLTREYMAYMDWEPDDTEPEPLEAKAVPTKGPPGLRSRADDVLDAVAGRPIGAKHRPCPKCQSDKFTIISPLEGGVATRRCQKCKLEIPWASVSSRLITDAHRIPSSAPGPYAGQAPPPPEFLDPSTPLFKKKSRS